MQEKDQGHAGFGEEFWILMLVYTSFCDSVALGIWSGHGFDVALTILLALTLFTIVMLITGVVCDLLRFSSADRIAAVFCGSKKSMASGVPMAQLMFGASPGLGLILLPIMIYHPLQLLICAALAARWSQRAPDASTG